MAAASFIYFFRDGQKNKDMTEKLIKGHIYRKFPEKEAKYKQLYFDVHFGNSLKLQKAQKCFLIHQEYASSRKAGKLSIPQRVKFTSRNCTPETQTNNYANF